MTYQQLQDRLSSFTTEELQKEVAVFDENIGRYHPLEYIGRCEGDEDVPEGHPIIIINTFNTYCHPEEPAELFSGTKKELDDLVNIKSSASDSRIKIRFTTTSFVRISDVAGEVYDDTYARGEVEFIDILEGTGKEIEGYVYCQFDNGSVGWIPEGVYKVTE